MRVRLEIQKSASTNHSSDTSLHRAEAGDASRLALQVIDDARQRFKVVAVLIGAVVQRLLVCSV